MAFSFKVDKQTKTQVYLAPIVLSKAVLKWFVWSHLAT